MAYKRGGAKTCDMKHTVVLLIFDALFALSIGRHTTSSPELVYTVSPVSVHCQANMSRRFSLVVLSKILNDLNDAVTYQVD